MANESTWERLNAAIAAHGIYKTRLLDAIDSGDLTEFSAATAGRDDQCAFGKWLHSEIDPSLKASSRYNKVKQLHASFHVSVAKAIIMAAGAKKAAQDTVQDAATPLTLELVAWKKEMDR